MELKYKLADCDVPLERHGALQSFRDKIKLWSSWLNDDKDHAIWDVLASMTWSDARFSFFRQIAVDDGASALHNTLLTQALVDGYIATQVLAIRRLIDGNPTVISLRRLLKDIMSNIKLFTRENYVCYDGLPYDYSAVRQEVWRGRVVGEKPTVTWGEKTGPEAYSVSEMCHKNFDRLSGVDAQRRKREDCLAKSLLDTIEKWLDESGAEELADWSHAYLAHAGSPESRQKLAEFSITMDKIMNTTRALARVAEAISADFLYLGGRSHALIPVAQFTPFERLDASVMKLASTDAWKLWHQFSDEQNRYLVGVSEELIRIPEKPIKD